MISCSTLYRTTLFASMSISACVGDHDGMDSSLSNPFVPRSIEAARKKDPDLVSAARRSEHKKKLHSMLLHRSSDDKTKNSSQGNGGGALRNAAAFEVDGDGDGESGNVADDKTDLGIIETNHPDADGQELIQDHSEGLHKVITEDALEDFYTDTMEVYSDNAFHQDFYDKTKNSSQGKGGGALRNAAAFEVGGDGESGNVADDKTDLGFIKTNHQDADGQELIQDHSEGLHREITEDALEGFYTDTVEVYSDNTFHQDFYKDQRGLKSGGQECPVRPLIGSTRPGLLEVPDDSYYHPFRGLVLCQMEYLEIYGLDRSCDSYYNILYPHVEVSCFNTSLVTHMANVFYVGGGATLPDMSQWDVSSVTNMSDMFFYASQGLALSIASWDVSSVENMGWTFSQFVGNPPVGNWNVSSVTNMQRMFYEALSANPPIGSWDTSSVEDMEYMFYDAESFNQPIDSWNLNSLMSARSMLRKAKAFNQCLSTWHYKTVQVSNSNMNNMFTGSGCENEGVEEGPWCQYASGTCPALDFPSAYPSMLPEPSSTPSESPGPSVFPSRIPSGSPSESPGPSSDPSVFPSRIPSGSPSNSPGPSSDPSVFPSRIPSGSPSSNPSGSPSESPGPSSDPSVFPSRNPSGSPSESPGPSSDPSVFPSRIPSGSPSSWPSSMPSGFPSRIPSGSPSSWPSSMPSGFPSRIPSGSPSSWPSSMPSGFPSDIPSSVPSSEPSPGPSPAPSSEPSPGPSPGPSSNPSSDLSLFVNVEFPMQAENCDDVDYEEIANVLVERTKQDIMEDFTERDISVDPAKLEVNAVDVTTCDQTPLRLRRLQEGTVVFTIQMLIESIDATLSQDEILGIVSGGIDDINNDIAPLGGAIEASKVSVRFVTADATREPIVFLSPTAPPTNAPTMKSEKKKEKSSKGAKKNKKAKKGKKDKTEKI